MHHATDLHRQKQPQQNDVRPSLRQRHVRMIALGGIVGASLFVGSGSVIHAVGPAAVLSYTLGGALVVLVMRMLGEMATASPTLGSFMEYAREYLGGWAGYAIGWLYWYFWVGVIAFESVAGAKLLVVWVPAIPQWVFSLILLLLLSGSNLASTRSFGETEFWLSSLKVVTIVTFLVTGALFVLGLWPGAGVSVGNIALDGFAPHGLPSILHGVVLVIFAYVGTEIVTIAAAESSDPVKAVVKATSSTVWRVVIFYVGSVTLLVMITPWHDIPTATSPYAAAFGKMGVPAAVTIINVVVLTTVLSVLNSGLYTASRMLFALQGHGWAPNWIADRNRRGAPWKAILASTAVGYIAVIMSYVAPDTIFDFIINSAGAVGLFVYAIIAGSQLRMRRRMERDSPEKLQLRMWCYPYLSWVTLAATLTVVGSMLLVDDARSQLYLSVLSLIIILATYPLVRRRTGARNGASAETSTTSS
ncbi:MULTISPECIES: amino acid permease [unclassified Streptomyces]|uniref:amino acid permease n=1 Tax=unclassified Streptomyces TaxID=2593676 RepID=UPI002E2FF6EE|nr:amino acid permease [Streptomyces sp. NBC_01361]